MPYKSAHMRFSNQKIADKLRQAGLRPTLQRLALAELLFTGGNRHVSAEALHAEALAANVPVSLATVYNTLNQFTEAGLLREVAVEGNRSYFDTNTSNHFHYFLEDKGQLVDIGIENVEVSGLPLPPKGMEIDRIDVIVRLRPLAD
ncbi:MAG TPA: Fur family transcriptional regulator [Aestuariivirga sp.]|nr:Fur family transcriptional regulator [Aestuariivirga sp.]